MSLVLDENVKVPFDRVVIVTSESGMRMEYWNADVRIGYEDRRVDGGIKVGDTITITGLTGSLRLTTPKI